MDKNLLNQAETLVEVLLENAYQEYFKGMLKKYGVSSPFQIPKEKRAEFFKELKAGWAAEKAKQK